MIRILTFIIFVAGALFILYILEKGVARKKKMILIGGGALAAAIGLFMQGAFSLYLSIAAILGISLLVALSYAKFVEKQQLKNQQLLQERRNSRSRTQSQSTETIKKPVHEPIAEKAFGMQTIAVIKEEQKVE
ncbi:hypothetical protein A1A1_03867 [Planococcus antarcticus DSM 14505]|uniref:Uncharacterized protein n=1 Tax=Planococcus antarcticus DSM 14505 TaxID=1185653 RepID=A0AA87INP9_9BACL|nr:hypothetical protein [Planococcus antarcticus]EIM07959.1 hypothetical protein A1A1_03867 [Planococcus antarcticus DSM 14505]